MSMQDPVADMLTRIRNALMAGKKEVSIPASSFKRQILEVILEEGYIAGIIAEENEAVQKNLIAQLRYHKNAPAIKELKRVSRPGLRRYVQATSVPRIYGGLGVAILSTSKGIMSHRRAKAEGVGGELLCTLF